MGKMEGFGKCMIPKEIRKLIKFGQDILAQLEIKIQEKYSFTIESKILSVSADEMAQHLRKHSVFL